MKVGIIGASFAKAAYLPALRHVEGAEVVAVASARLASAEAAAKAFGVPHAYDDWRHMLNHHRLDLVCIATPTVTHAEMTLAALDAGAHVLCEKPTAMNAAEARAMLDRAETLGRVHMIDHELRFNPNRRKVKSLIDAGAIGAVRHVAISNVVPAWGDPASRAKGDWWSLASQGGGRLGANGSHQVDLVRWWFGEVGAVDGLMRTMVPNRVDKATGEAWTADADDFCTFTLEMASGPLVQILISAVARHGLDNTTQIFGSEGTILLHNTGEKLLLGKPGAAFEEVQVEDPNASLPGLNPGIWNVSVVGVMRELAAAIREKRPVREGATFWDGWRNQLVLDAVAQSSRERRWVSL
ncbi:Gfo/Idh/MocA family protein [Alsobacter sp. R-9]